MNGNGHSINGAFLVSWLGLFKFNFQALLRSGSDLADLDGDGARGGGDLTRLTALTRIG